MNELNSNEHNNDERWAAAHRRGNFLTGICIVLAAVILGVALYAYLTPSRQQMADFGRSLRARIENVSKRASQSAEDAYNRLANVTERVSRLESSREADQVQIAQLTLDVNQVRDAEHRHFDDLAQVRRQMEADRFDENQQFAALMRDQDRDRKNIDAVASQIAMRKVPFEATKNNGRDVADGISLNIENTDTEYGRVSGWIWIANDRRTLWLQDQPAQEPVIFYGYKDGQKRELVITNVAANSVTGYLLLPKEMADQPTPTETGPAGE
jgi:hypothetical protein